MSRIHLLPLICVSAALLGLVSPALSNEPAAEPTLACSNAMNTHDMNICAQEELDNADTALNAIYKTSLAAIPGMASEQPYDAKTWEQALRASQRAWVAFRDAECNGHVSLFLTGGTATTAEVLSCMTQMTQARAKSLKEQYGPN